MFSWFRRSKGRAGDQPSFEEPVRPVSRQSRIAVLESAEIDGVRRLVLVRCDDVEHLILVGGPADMVVERDVRKDRAPEAAARGLEVQKARRAESAPQRPQAAPRQPAVPQRDDTAARDVKPALPKQAQPEPAEPAPPLLAAPPAATPVAPPAPEAKASEPKRIAPRPAEAAEPTARPNLTAVPALLRHAGARNGQAEAGLASGRPGGEVRPGQARPRPAEPNPGRRDAPLAPAARQRPPQVQPAPAPAGRPVHAPPRAQPAAFGRESPPLADRRDRAGQEASPSRVPLPAAALPAAAPPSAETSASAPKPATSPATTLGDLADRLEEALAREVQSAHGGRGELDLGLDAFGFDPEPDTNAPTEAPAPQQPSEPEQVEGPGAVQSTGGPTTSAAPEPEVRKDARPPAERQDEAPVISLNARRREAVDPLEDEMARLLGELTGDTNRR